MIASAGSNPTTLTAVFSTFLPLIEAEMRAVLAAPDTATAGHYGIMEYHLGWRDRALAPAGASSGKRLRPVLCMMACAAAGGEAAVVAPAAAGLELLHNFSLLHDDIEDNSDTRRHRPTAWTVFGMPLACNAGDGMFSVAHLAFYRMVERGVPVPTVLDALRRFDQTCLALTEGQFMDMSFEASMSVSPEAYYRMIAGKTGALLAAAPEIGALVAGAGPEDVASYRRFGSELGRAFQLQDDVLGIWGDEATTGKSAASDITNKKKTLPVLLGLAHQVSGAALAALYGGGPLRASDIQVVLELLNAAGAREGTERAVGEAISAAHEALNAVAPRAEQGQIALLHQLLDSLVARAS